MGKVEAVSVLVVCVADVWLSSKFSLLINCLLEIVAGVDDVFLMM